MAIASPPFRVETEHVSSYKNHIGIENHKRTAAHLEAAAKCHLEAAKHHEAGDHAKGDQSTIIAQSHISLASLAMRENAKHKSSISWCAF